MAERRAMVRLRPERRNHVWGYDFVQIRTKLIPRWYVHLVLTIAIVLK